MRLLATAAWFLAGAFVGGGIGLTVGDLLAYRYFLGRLPDHLHTEVREKAILSQAGQMPVGGIVVFGDSIVELASFEGLCGGKILNAGVGGARLSHVIALQRQVLAVKRFGTIVISVGVNDAQKNQTNGVSAWLRDYDGLLSSLKGYKVYVVAINPVETGKALGERYFDLSFIAAANAGLADLSKAHEVSLVEPAASADGLTVDGVHLNALGYEGYRTRLAAAMRCTPADAKL